MPAGNQFRHQSYPTTPSIRPSFHRLKVTDAGTGPSQFSDLHEKHGIAHVVLVHGTFMGDDPLAIAESLKAFGKRAPIMQKLLDPVADQLLRQTKPLTGKLTGDVANYSPEFRDRFQQLVGDDPQVQFLDPTWSGQNHHLARADLAVRLICLLDDLQVEPEQKVLLWGHSHAGNGFALLSNLIANEPTSVQKFFNAASNGNELHWRRALEILKNAPTPHPFASSLDIAAFGTPVRYGWDSTGYRKLIHLLHHRNWSKQNPLLAEPMYPPHRFSKVVGAEYGDWVQAFAIAGTDVVPPTSMSANAAMELLLQRNLRDPVHGLDTRLIPTERIRNACARWKTGTRCHTDGLNLLVEYEPCGRNTGLAVPIEESMFGHGVATTIDWLPAHLALVQRYLSDAD